MSSSPLENFYEHKYSDEAAMSSVDLVDMQSSPTDRFQGAVATLADRLDGKDVLELAAGSGRIAQSLAALGSGFNSWTLSDWSKNRVEGMRLRLEAESRFNFAIVDASEPTSALGDQLFDVIVSIALVEHLVDPLGAMRNTRRLLKPGGFIYLDTPNIAKWTRRVKLSLGMFPSTSSLQEGLVKYDGSLVDLHDEGHLHYFTYASLERMLTERCGFSKVERVPYGATSRLSPLISTQLARRLPKLFSEVSIIAYA